MTLYPRWRNSAPLWKAGRPVFADGCCCREIGCDDCFSSYNLVISGISDETACLNGLTYAIPSWDTTPGYCSWRYVAQSLGDWIDCLACPGEKALLSVVEVQFIDGAWRLRIYRECWGWGSYVLDELWKVGGTCPDGTYSGSGAVTAVLT